MFSKTYHKLFVKMSRNCIKVDLHARCDKGTRLIEGGREGGRREKGKPKERKGEKWNS